MSHQKRDTLQIGGGGSAALHQRETPESADYYTELIEFSADAIISIDERGTIELFNKAAEQLFGYTKQEAIGQNIKLLMPEQHSSKHDQYLKTYRDTGTVNIINRWREVEGLRKDGAPIAIEIGIREFWVAGRRIFTGIVRDLTEIKAARSEIVHKSRDLLEMSTPAIVVWDGVLVLPLIGTMDSQRMQICTENTLDRLSQENARVMIIDITGVPVLDTMVANRLIAMAASVELMGGQCILTGISPATAITIVNLGIDLSSLNTRGTLQAGLKLAIQLVEGAGRRT